MTELHNKLLFMLKQICKEGKAEQKHLVILLRFKQVSLVTMNTGISTSALRFVLGDIILEVTYDWKQEDIFVS